MLKLLEVGVVRDRSRGRKPVAVTGPDDAAKALRAILPQDREGFAVLLLNARHHVTAAHLVSVGSLEASIVHPREVFKVAMLANAATVIVGHNHPSGNTEPSEDDLAITRRLVAAGDIIGIKVLDHVIVTARAQHSMRAAKEGDL